MQLVVVPHPHVTSDPKVLGGSPRVRGSRVPVRRLYGFYAAGTPVRDIARRYPQLPQAAVLDALAFALDNPEVIEADLEREREVLKQAGAQMQARIHLPHVAIDDHLPGGGKA